MELLEALKTIRDECSRHDLCTTCPLRYKDDDRTCSLSHINQNPSDWMLIDDIPKIPRLFV